MSKENLLTGVVVSNKMAHTLVVSVERKAKHPVYGKFIRKTGKFYVDTKGQDDSKNIAIGSTVSFKECKPLSKLKRWVLVEVL